ncbi:MAG TPA: peptidase M23 [Methylothermaceae bacterium]|nr:peptidase M23 [Methylothermaceae bacterium]
MTFKIPVKSLLRALGIGLILSAFYDFGEDPQPKPQAQTSVPPSVQDKVAEQAQPPVPNATLPIKEPETTASQRQENWIRHRIHRGETLAGIFKRYRLSRHNLNDLLSSDEHLLRELTQLYPGKTVKLLVNEKGELKKLVYQRSHRETITAARTGENDFDIEKIFHRPQKRLGQASGIIQSNLYSAGKRAGLTDNLIMQLTDIFGWEIDFQRGTRPGDQFTVLYEKLYVNGRHIGNGSIVAAEFINRGQVHQAIRFTLPDGRTAYYTPEGRSLRKAFLRMPVQSARITSRFNLKRRHPILHRIRAHKGVDYAAPIGTPVRATGDGKIIFRGWKGGYGRVIILQHGRRYTTLYAHLHRFNRRFKLGSRVNQGDVIAYVGKSGLATGPHLHYEFRINGVHKDPLTVPLPTSKPIPASLMTAFRQQADSLLAELEQHRPTALVEADHGKQ